MAISLGEIVSIILKEIITKSELVRLGKWSVHILSLDQITYAALDAIK